MKVLKDSNLTDHVTPAKHDLFAESESEKKITKKRKKRKYALRKEPVRIREKELKNGNISLYFEIYWEGQRAYDFLGLYLVFPKSDADRLQNQETYKVAEIERAQRVLDLQCGKYKIKNPNKDASFIRYMEGQVEQRKMENGNNDKKSTADNWNAALSYVKAFAKEKEVKFKDIDGTWLTNFKLYLNTNLKKGGTEKLSANTQHTYFNKVKACLEAAFIVGIVPEQVGKRVKAPKQGEAKIIFLEWKEVQALAKTECESPLLKRAFLFSVLSGLRWSDIAKLKWGEIRGNAQEGFFIDFSQKKTDGFSILPFANQAMNLLGNRSNPDSKIFEGLKYSAWNNMLLTRWMIDAGIYRHITFHVARHTYATQLLAHGVDIYVVSKMLGHKTIKTTEVYAKVVIQLKVKAARSLPLISFDNDQVSNTSLSNYTNSEADIAMLANWLNDNGISVSSLMTVLSNTKEMIGSHTKKMILQGDKDERPIPQGQVLTAVKFISSLTLSQ